MSAEPSDLSEQAVAHQEHMDWIGIIADMLMEKFSADVGHIQYKRLRIYISNALMEIPLDELTSIIRGLRIDKKHAVDVILDD